MLHGVLTPNPLPKKPGPVQVHSDSKKEEKTGVDVSSMPSMKENIDKTVNDPTARGHAE